MVLANWITSIRYIIPFVQYVAWAVDQLARTLGILKSELRNGVWSVILVQQLSLCISSSMFNAHNSISLTATQDVITRKPCTPDNLLDAL